MKRKLLMAMLTTIFASCLLGGLSACGEKHTHVYNENIIAPTCTERGYSTFSCSCGDSYIDNYVDKINHDYKEKTIAAATCSQTGIKNIPVQIVDIIIRITTLLMN